MLFEDLPVFPVGLADDELQLLAKLDGCDWPANQEIDDDQRGVARRLADKGLIRISRQKMDPVAMSPTWFAGKLPAAMLREA